MKHLFKKAINRIRRALREPDASASPPTRKGADDYLEMQRSFYEEYAAKDDISPGQIGGDHVVGSWEQHNRWPDYETCLMREVPPDGSWVAIEYGCGPGRNILRWSDRFARIDGVDISSVNLANARRYLASLIPEAKSPNLFLTRGSDCGDAPANSYDFAFSTICLQHICVHRIRTAIFADLYRCLKPGGLLSVQMGYGVPSQNTVDYHADFYDAPGTNRACDVAIADPDQVAQDLRAIGFVDFDHVIRPVGPGDLHPNWIFFSARKPGGDVSADARA